MYVTKDETTEKYFHRFSKLKLNGQNWEAQAVDNMSIEGIIVVALQEDYRNTIQEKIEEEEALNIPEDFGDEEEIYISGEYKDESDRIVYPFDERTYFIEGTGNGVWTVSDNKKVKILNQDSSAVKISIITGRSGEFNLCYIREGQEDVVLPITIESL